MAARNEDRRDARYDDACDRYDAYDGMDALMAAITDEPLPEGALDDDGFAAEHRAALADVALLREQLGLIGEALAAEGPAVNGTEAEAVTPAGRPVAARPAPGTEGTPRPAQEAAPETEPAPAPTPPVKPRAASAPSARPARPRPPRRRPRALALAFGALAASVAVFTVVGLGWLIARGGVGASSSGADTQSSAKQDGGGPHEEAGANDSASSSRLDAAYVACARLIAEGTVTSLEPVPGTGQSRVTLDVERSYKPEKRAKGGDEVVFPVDEHQASRLREGEPVLVGVHRDEAAPDLLVTGEKEIARERARITRELTEARGLKCEDGG